METLKSGYAGRPNRAWSFRKSPLARKRSLLEIKNQDTWMRCMMRVRGVHKRRENAKLVGAANRFKRKIDILQTICQYVAPDLKLSEDEEDALNQVRQRCMEMRHQTRKLLRQIESGSPAVLSTLTQEIVPESEGLEDVLEELTGTRWNFAIAELIELIDRVTRGIGQDRKSEKILFYLQSESRKLGK